MVQVFVLLEHTAIVGGILTVILLWVASANAAERNWSKTAQFGLLAAAVVVMTLTTIAIRHVTGG